jgi:acetylornithine/N-succinyldiaminopimelate aminotransferase
MHATQISTAALMDIAARPDLVFVEGRGSWLTDHAGRRYLDFIQGWAVNTLGHCSSTMITALIKQASRLINCSPSYYNEPMARLAALLTDLSGLDRVFFTNTGAEANEGAIKLARKWGQLHRSGAAEIVTLQGGFHGRTLATMAASGKPHWETLFEPKVPGFRKVPLNDIAALADAVTARTVAVMLEPIQGEAGVFVAEDEYLRAVRALTRERGVLLILDEVQTGIGRTGKMFGFEHAGVTPDIMTLAKGLGGGVPLGALVAKREVCCFAHGDQGGTFNGNPLMTAVGCAVLEEVARPDFLAHVVAQGQHLADVLVALSHRHDFGEVRGRGLLRALDLRSDMGPVIVERARAQGLLINAPRTDSLRFMPALNVTAAEIDEMIAILDCVCGAARASYAA